MPTSGKVRLERALSAEAERSLVLAATERDDSAARAELIEAFQPLIASVARLYRNIRAVNRLELMQEGAAGLLKALDRYDVSRGTPFWAYASWWVRQSMQQLVSEVTRPVVLSDRAFRQLAKVTEVRRNHLQAHSREPSTAELASETGFTEDQVEDLTAVDRTPRALEQPPGGDDDAAATFGELLVDPSAEQAFDDVDRRIELEQLRGLPTDLGERERTILRARFGFDGRDETLREIAGRLELSAERVRQIEEQALEKLRMALPLPSAA